MPLRRVRGEALYDGIWACASLLHLSPAEMPEALARLWRALKPGGVFYCSFKLGQGEREQQGRQFTDADEARLGAWLATLDAVADIQFWRSADRRSERSEQWLNALIRRAAAPVASLVTGGDSDPFLPHLCAAIHAADEIDLAVAFVKTTGLRLLLPDLLAALGRAGEEGYPGPAARVRILTSDYLDITDPDALRRLMLLQEQGAQCASTRLALAAFT
ncbi:hypothetical protein ACFSHR_13950 [Azotobacter chroococcum]